MAAGGDAGAGDHGSVGGDGVVWLAVSAECGAGADVAADECDAADAVVAAAVAVAAFAGAGEEAAEFSDHRGDVSGMLAGCAGN